MEERPNLEGRRAEILTAIVAHYVGSGEPVGSKTIVERFGLGVSAATVRNDMAVLEDWGLIYQPHTSAGRVPTDLGYRFFVDSTSEGAKLSAPESRRIARFFGEPRWELEDSLRQTASFLSNLTDHAALVFAPALGRSSVRHVELVGLSGGRAMIVLVTDTGRVENHIVGIPDGVDDVQLEHTAEMLNKAVEGVALETVSLEIRKAIEKMPLELREMATVVAATLEKEVSAGDNERVFLDGTSNIVDETKFADIETVRQVIGALEHRRLLFEVLADAVSTEMVSVRIGAENPIEEMQNCSVVFAPYGAEGVTIGSLGVVGPTRMDYKRTIAAVHEVASHLGNMLASLGL
jgi:heat-inducible transcriptional repressor